MKSLAFLIAFSSAFTFSGCAPSGALKSNFHSDRPNNSGNTPDSYFAEPNFNTSTPDLNPPTTNAPNQNSNPQPQTQTPNPNSNSNSNSNSQPQTETLNPQPPTQTQTQTQTQTRTRTPTPTQISPPIPMWAQKSQNATWTASLVHALKSLGHSLITSEIRDAGDFCPAYSRLNENDRLDVWVQLISAMAKYESDLNPLSAFKENFSGRDGQPIVSRGLLQISKGSANDYGCHIEKEADLENPDTNLHCGVRILNALVSKDHAIHGLRQDAIPGEIKARWLGAARYWSVLRGKAKDTMIQLAVHQMPKCH